MRSERYLRKTSGDKRPKQALAFEAESELVPHPQLDGVEIEQLLSWHCWYWTEKNGDKQKADYYHGTDSPSFWRFIDRCLCYGGVTWAFAVPASRAVGLLGLWDEMEAGSIYLTERDYRDNQDGDSKPLPGVRGPYAGGTPKERLFPDGPLPSMRRGDTDAVTNTGQRPTRTGTRPLGYCVLEDPPTIIQCKRRGRAGTLKIVDLRNYGYSGAEAPTEPRLRAEWIRDTALTMCRVLRDNGLGSLQNTAASQAFYSFKRRHLHHAVYIHCDAETLDLERRSYYGGRSEAKRLGMAPCRIWQCDFRSFYPHIGATLALPVRFVGRHDNPGTAELREKMAVYGAIAECHIATQVPAYPVRRGRETIYPIGKFATVLAGPELQYALDCGHLSSLGTVAYYEMRPACAEYAQAIQSLRIVAEQKGDRSGAEYLKRLGVSLYGKFAQTSARWVNTTERYADHPYEAWYQQHPEGGLERWRSIAWEVQREHKPKPGERPEKTSNDYARWAMQVISRETAESVPALAAYITSAGRMLLWRAIRCAGDESVYYYDTDAIFVDEAGFARLCRSGYVGLGEWGKLSVRAVYSSFEVKGIKYYLADSHIVCSGLPKGDIQSANDRETYYLRAWLGRAILRGEKPRTERIRLFYERSATYYHGLVGEDGWVRPLEM